MDLSTLVISILIWTLAVCAFKQQLTYFLKWWVFAFSFSITSIIWIPIGLILRRQNALKILHVTPPMPLLSSMLGITWDFKGIEHLLTTEGAVVVINHKSALDLLGLYELRFALQNCSILAKKSLFWVFPFGFAAYLMGTVFIDRNNNSASKSTLDKLGEDMRTENKKVVIFPEGTRNPKDRKELLPFKKGAFHIALQYRVPIIPVVIGPYDFLKSDELWFGQAGKVEVSIMPPIPTKDYKSEDVSCLAQDVREVMNQEFARLCKISS